MNKEDFLVQTYHQIMYSIRLADKKAAALLCLDFVVLGALYGWTMLVAIHPKTCLIAFLTVTFLLLTAGIVCFFIAMLPRGEKVGNETDDGCLAIASKICKYTTSEKYYEAIVKSDTDTALFTKNLSALVWIKSKINQQKSDWLKCGICASLGGFGATVLLIAIYS